MREGPNIEKALMSREPVFKFNPVLPVLLVAEIGSISWGWSCFRPCPAGVAPSGRAERSPGCSSAHDGCCAVARPMTGLARPARRGRGRIHFKHLVRILILLIILTRGLFRGRIHFKHLVRILILLIILTRGLAERGTEARWGLFLPGDGASTRGARAAG